MEFRRVLFRSALVFTGAPHEPSGVCSRRRCVATRLDGEPPNDLDMSRQERTPKPAFGDGSIWSLRTFCLTLDTYRGSPRGLDPPRGEPSTPGNLSKSRTFEN